MVIFFVDYNSKIKSLGNHLHLRATPPCWDGFPSSLKVGKRIKQNLLEVDLDEASDEDISYVPPKGIFGQIVSASILIHPYFSRYKVEST